MISDIITRPTIATIIYEALPTAMRRLDHDSSPAAQTSAAVVYDMIVEGVLAGTGYHAYFTVLNQNGDSAGQRQGIHYLERDDHVTSLTASICSRACSLSMNPYRPRSNR